MREHFATRPTSLFRSELIQTSRVWIPIEGLQALADEAHIAYNHFIRTSEPDHRFAVQYFWVCTIKDRHALADSCKAHAQTTRLDLLQET